MSLPASVPFTKAHGCGNDFLIIELDLAHGVTDLPAFTRRICHRQTGIGADGVEWVRAAHDEVSARLINADGSEAEISGNGTRCVAAYWIDRHGGDKVAIRTGAGIKHCSLQSRSGRTFQFEMKMGAPLLQGELHLLIAGKKVIGSRVSLGNPHVVVFVDDFNFNWQAEGAEIQRQPAFSSTRGVNVEFVHVMEVEKVESRFFERGVGETQSSGTGTCASAVAAIASNRAKSPVTVSGPGGSQTVRWQGQGTDIFLVGPSELVCAGEFFI